MDFYSAQVDLYLGLSSVAGPNIMECLFEAAQVNARKTKLAFIIADEDETTGSGTPPWPSNLWYWTTSVRDETQGKAAADDLAVGGEPPLQQDIMEVWILNIDFYDSIPGIAEKSKPLQRLDIILNAGLGPANRVVNQQTGQDEMIRLHYLSTALLAILLLPIDKDKRVARLTFTCINLTLSEVAVWLKFKFSNHASILEELDAFAKICRRESHGRIHASPPILDRGLANRVPASGASPGTVNDSQTYCADLRPLPSSRWHLKFLTKRSVVAVRILTDAAAMIGTKYADNFHHFRKQLANHHSNPPTLSSSSMRFPPRPVLSPKSQKHPCHDRHSIYADRSMVYRKISPMVEGIHQPLGQRFSGLARERRGHPRRYLGRPPATGVLDAVDPALPTHSACRLVAHFLSHPLGVLHAARTHNLPGHEVLCASVGYLVPSFFGDDPAYTWNDVVDALIASKVARTRLRALPFGGSTARSALLHHRTGWTTVRVAGTAAGTQRIEVLWLQACPQLQGVCYPFAQGHTHVAHVVPGFFLTRAIMVGSCRSQASEILRPLVLVGVAG
ncbi:hypothetical protein S40293_00013 [Stachybotrys chartarum IBT 40293]|nr:hypothetical protein S40293_00013 [Stachybotrys chartarum IBT 40293]